MQFTDQSNSQQDALFQNRGKQGGFRGKNLSTLIFDSTMHDIIMYIMLFDGRAQRESIVDTHRRYT